MPQQAQPAPAKEEVILRKKRLSTASKIISSKSKRNCQLETEKYCLERNLELNIEIDSQFKVGKQIDCVTIKAEKEH